MRRPEFAPGRWYANRCSVGTGLSSLRWGDSILHLTIGNVLEREITRTLRRGAPYYFDDEFPTIPLSQRFFVAPDSLNNDTFVILDHQWELIIHLPRLMAENPAFDLACWYEDLLIDECEIQCHNQKINVCPDPDKKFQDHDDDDPGNDSTSIFLDSDQQFKNTYLELNGVQVPWGTYPAVQRNAAVTKDASRKVPKPVVITTKINRQPAHALLDSGSLGDFMSSTVADQLKVKKDKLTSPLGLQLAVQGSCSKINSGTKVNLEYQNIKEERYFDIINLSNYDFILGTPWLYQDQVSLGFNPACVLVGSDTALPLDGVSITSIASHAVALEI